MVKSDWLVQLKQKMTETGNIGDVIGQMITINVALFILEQIRSCYEKNGFSVNSVDELLKKSYSILQENPRENKIPLAFCAAEVNWQGKIENIKSSINDQAIYQAQKSFVIDSDQQLLLLKTPKPDFLAVILHEKQAADTYSLREDAQSNFITSNGQVLNHFHVSFRGKANPDTLWQIPLKYYRLWAIEIARRELTTLAVFAMAMLEFHKIILPPEIHAATEKILESRSQWLDKITKTDLLAVNNILNFFHEATKDIFDLHPFWQKTIIMAKKFV